MDSLIKLFDKALSDIDAENRGAVYLKLHAQLLKNSINKTYYLNLMKTSIKGGFFIDSLER